MKCRITVLAILVGFVVCAAAQNVPALFDRRGGLVPDPKTALKIAEAVLVPIYGVKIMQDKPYTIKLANGRWMIDGSVPKGAVGGSFHIVIQQRDAKIIEIGCGA
jgi:hypothetical protein